MHVDTLLRSMAHSEVSLEGCRHPIHEHRQHYYLTVTLMVATGTICHEIFQFDRAFNTIHSNNHLNDSHRLQDIVYHLPEYTQMTTCTSPLATSVSREKITFALRVVSPEASRPMIKQNRFMYDMKTTTTICKA